MDLQNLQKIIEPEANKTYTEGNLLRKYGIPIQNLDFPYIEKCVNARELEKIYDILQSGEEGHYPHLIKLAEEKLKLLKPNSRFLRTAIQILQKENLDRNERNNIECDLQEWLENVKKDSEELEGFKNSSKLRENPPVRPNKKISNIQKEPMRKEQKIRSTDYESWDKYDVDTELLKMDLEEEKIKEEIKKKAETSKVKHKKVRINEFSTKTETIYEANMALAKGKEYYNSQDFLDAITYFNASITLNASSDAYYLRCLAYIKLEKYEKAIKDGQEALKLNKNNINAKIKIAQCYELLQKFEDAYKYYLEANYLDPNNTEVQEGLQNVQKNIKVDKQQFKRMFIKEENSQNVTNNNNLFDKNCEVKKKSILKKKTSTEISIPGTSNMRPPYYVSINTTDPNHVKNAEDEMTKMAKNRPIPHPVFLAGNSSDEETFFPKTNVQKKEVKIYTKRSKMYKKSSKNKICIGSNTKICENNTKLNNENLANINGNNTKQFDELNDNLNNDKTEYENSKNVGESKIEIINKKLTNVNENNTTENFQLNDSSSKNTIVNKNAKISNGIITENSSEITNNLNMHLNNGKPQETNANLNNNLLGNSKNVDYKTTKVIELENIKIELKNNIKINQNQVESGKVNENHKEDDVFLKKENVATLENNNDNSIIHESDNNEIKQQIDVKNEENVNKNHNLQSQNKAESNNNANRDCNGNENQLSVVKTSTSRNESFKNDKGGGGEPCLEEEIPDNARSEELHLPFTFFRVWSVASRDKTYGEYAEILRKLDVNQLPEIIGLKLDAKMLSSILQCLFKHFAVASEIEKVYNTLIALSNVPRFTLIRMFMGRNDQICIQNLLDFLKQHDRNLPEDVAQKYR